MVKPMSATVNTLGTAFSQVLIASTDKAKEAMRQGCYDYLSSGGFGASGLMALLGGMNPRPLSLIFHLFVVTLSATVQLLSPFPSPLGIWHSLRLLGVSHYIFTYIYIAYFCRNGFLPKFPSIFLVYLCSLTFFWVQVIVYFLYNIFISCFPT